jgi:hypothetical protein
MELIDRLLNTQEGGKILSILFGLGLSALFRRTCIGDKCIIVRSMPEEIRETTFKITNRTTGTQSALPSVTQNGKCVRFETKLTECELTGV